MATPFVESDVSVHDILRTKGLFISVRQQATDLHYGQLLSITFAAVLDRPVQLSVVFEKSSGIPGTGLVRGEWRRRVLSIVPKK